MTTAPSGLRERSKQRRRREIQVAALQLFTEHGYEGATLADIAAAAEVAPRTLSLYFPSKADLALAPSNQIAERLSATIRAHPGAGFLELIDRWLTEETLGSDPELALLANAMFTANPDLRALSSKAIGDAVQLAGTSMLDAIGLGPEDPLLPVVAVSVAAAIHEYLALIARGGADAAQQARVMDFVRALCAASTSLVQPRNGA